MPIPILVLQVQITTIPARTLLSGFLLTCNNGIFNIFQNHHAMNVMTSSKNLSSLHFRSPLNTCKARAIGGRCQKGLIKLSVLICVDNL